MSSPALRERTMTFTCDPSTPYSSVRTAAPGDSLPDSGCLAHEVSLGMDSRMEAPKQWNPSLISTQSGPSSHRSPVEQPIRAVRSLVESGRKRPSSIKTRADVAYPRKRATAACQLCRARKVKCNNARPSCASCITAHATCVYGDNQDQSSFDPASIVILDRLDQVLSRLDRYETTVVPDSPAEQTTIEDTSSIFPGSQSSAMPWQNHMTIPARKKTPDSILQWSIFRDRYPESFLTDAVFEAENLEDGLNSETSVKDLQSTSKARGRGISEDAMPHLVQRFLALVHTKNPILDVGTILAYSQRAAEFGLGWDPPSCLVLLACALGCVAQPFGADASGSGPRISLEQDEDELQDGELYYNLARRRFGFLERGLLVPQCHFLAGVYLMYTLRPLMAWSKFHDASKSYHLYLQCQARKPHQPADEPSYVRRRGQEQRLYWSCYKSECELRSELDLPNSSLAEFEYPDMHPSPPDLDAVEEKSQQEEQSWFYYLTEITLRRITNHVLNTLYASDYSMWSVESMPSRLKAAREFDEQLSKWYRSMPDQIRFSEDMFHTEELPYMIQLRYFHLRLLIYQPFLHYAIHNPPDACHQYNVQSMAERALSTCLLLVRDDNFRHRHHGTWFYARGITTAALIIIASASSETVPVPPNWRDFVYCAIEKLQYWEAEAPGISRALQVLESKIKNSVPDLGIDSRH